MTATPDHPDTALMLLFGRHDTLAALGQAIGHARKSENLDRAMRNLPPATREAAARELTRATAGLIDLNLIDLLLTGWREYEDLTSAARRTLATPGSVELVQLVTHRVTATQQPYVAIQVNGQEVATVRLGITVTFDISALLARIRAGLLVAVLTGSCDITATLAIDEIEVASKRAHLDLPGEIAFSRELPLLPARDYAASVGNAASRENKPAEWWQTGSAAETTGSAESTPWWA